MGHVHTVMELLAKRRRVPVQATKISLLYKANGINNLLHHVLYSKVQYCTVLCSSALIGGTPCGWLLKDH